MIIAFLAVAVSLQSPAKPIDERHAIYAWLDGCDYPILTAPFVQVQDKDQLDDQSRIFAGFLVGKGKGFFKVLRANLQPNYYSTTVRHQAKYRPIVFRDWIKRFGPTILAWKSSADTPESFYMLPFGQLSLCVLSRLCESQGMETDAVKFYEAARNGNYCSSTRNGGQRRFESLIEALPYQFANDTERMLVWEISSTETPRAETIADANFALKNLPAGDERSFAEEVATRLLAQERERSIHVAPTSRSASMDQCIAERIYQLQDIGGSPRTHPGTYDATEQPKAKQLIDLGFVAIPRLIGALDDKRFTLAHGDTWDQSSRALFRVRDVAVQILAKISGRDFVSMTPMSDQASRNAMRRAEAWWKVARGLGEIPATEAAVRSGLGRVDDLAEHLLKLEPRRAIKVIVQGFPRIRESYTRQNVLWILKRFHSKQVRDFAKYQAWKGLDLGTRMSAAELLEISDLNGAVSAMIHELDKPINPKDSDGSQLISFLLQSQQVRAVRAMRLRYPKFNRQQRLDIVSSSDLRPNSAAKDYLSEVEDLLAFALTDRTKNYGTSMSFGGQSFEDSRTCDVASYMLSQSFGKKYTFKRLATESQLETIRLQNLATWRKSRPRSYEIIPNEVSPPEVPAKVILPILARATSVDPRVRREAIRVIHLQGLRALPPLLRALDRLPARHAARADLTAEARRLALIVSHVTVSPLETNKDKWIENLVGKPLDLASMRHLYRSALDGPDVTLTISREVGVQGVDIGWLRRNPTKHRIDVEASMEGNIGPYSDDSSTSGDRAFVEEGTPILIARILDSKPNDQIYWVYRVRH